MIQQPEIIQGSRVNLVVSSMGSNQSNQRRQEDLLLVPDQYPELNGYFYETKPYSYFRHKIQQLLLFAGKPEMVEQQLREGIEYEGIKLEINDEEAEASEEREQNASLDSEILIHHIGETLLRLYLAHADLAPCPWLELSRLRSFRRFKEIINERFVESDPEAHIEQVRDVFIPVPREALVDLPDEAWEFGPGNIENLLRHFASEILNGAHLYNAAKHGLAVRSGESAFTLGDSSSPVLQASGRAITFLEVADRSNRKRWVRSVEWVDVTRNVAFVEVGCQLIECLWRIAKWRYLKEQPDAIRVFETPRYQDLVPRLSIQVEKMSRDLAYYKVEATRELIAQEIQIASRVRSTRPIREGAASGEDE